MDVLIHAADSDLRRLFSSRNGAAACPRIVGRYREARDLVIRLQSNPPDAVFLRVQGHDTSVLDVVDRYRDERKPLFVVLSECAEVAVRAFDVDAFDFIRLPTCAERIASCVERATSVIERRGKLREMNRRMSVLKKQVAERGREGAAGYPDRLIIKTQGRLAFVDADEVDWIEATDVYVRLHNGEKSHLVRERLKNVERKLDPDRFLRIHRSTIVNVDRIREVTPHAYGGAIVVLEDGTKLKVSRTYRDRLNPTFG